MIDIEDSLVYVRGHFHELYPPEEGRAKTFAHIPDRLHKEILKMASDRGLKVYEVLAGLMDFLQEYEDAHRKELAAQRKANKR